MCVCTIRPKRLLIKSDFCRQSEIMVVYNPFSYSKEGCRYFAHPVVHFGVRETVCPRVDKLVC